VIPVFGQALPGIQYVERPGAYGLLPNAAGELAIVQTPNGLFLPGGGLEPEETPESALRREVREETGFEITALRFLGQAIQFHWSEFYQKHFKKVGSFYQIEAHPDGGLAADADHVLWWMTREQAAQRLSQEFQRWVVSSAGSRSL